MRPSSEWALHGEGWMIARVVEGTGYWMQKEGARVLNVGEGFVLANGFSALLRASQLGMLKIEWFIIQPQLLGGLLSVAEWHRLGATVPRPAPKTFFFTASEPLGQKLAHIANQSRSDKLGMRCALLQIWVSAVAHLLNESSAAIANTNKLRERFRQMTGRMLEVELSESSLKQLAGRLNCSERHFSRLFREEFGVSLRSRQMEMRLQRARHLLVDSNTKIINVAYVSGYRHLGLFSAMFKKRFGVTPAEWRKQNAPAKRV
ncbi:MAG TPA: helix-turn-helix transcriptional regulator [Verrucomicrobiae bacterium]|nr:helix-turn-helix transcriptional regulator [Verrucomicrobiae bacterium]